MKTSLLLASAVVLVCASGPLRADTVTVATEPSGAVAQAPQVIVIRESAPSSSVVVVNRQQPADGDIYYTRRPYGDGLYINGETAALVGTAALIGGAAWGYNRHRRHHHRRWR